MFKITDSLISGTSKMLDAEEVEAWIDQAEKKVCLTSMAWCLEGISHPKHGCISDMPEDLQKRLTQFGPTRKFKFGYFGGTAANSLVGSWGFFTGMAIADRICQDEFSTDVAGPRIRSGKTMQEEINNRLTALWGQMYSASDGIEMQEGIQSQLFSGLEFGLQKHFHSEPEYKKAVSIAVHAINQAVEVTTCEQSFLFAGHIDNWNQRVSKLEQQYKLMVDVMLWLDEQEEVSPAVSWALGNAKSTLKEALTQAQWNLKAVAEWYIDDNDVVDDQEAHEPFPTGYGVDMH